MKVLYLTPGCFDKGGISRYNRYQISALREIFGADRVRVLSLAGPRPGDFEEPFSVFWHGEGPRPGSKVRFAWQVFKQTIVWKPDLVLAAHVNFSGLAVLAGRLARCKTLLNTYGLEVWSGLTKDASWGLMHTDHVVADCHYTARYLERELLRPPGSVEVIWDCVDLKRFNPGVRVDQTLLTKYQIPDPGKNKLIISLGRISKTAAHKGYDRLIRAFSLFHEQHPAARLVLAGKGDLIETLKSLSSECGVSEKVIFTGMIEENDLPAVYRLAHVFSLVSDRGKGRGEGIPLTPLEAMACHVPIIVGNQDGSQEAVMEERNGFVVDPFDIEDQARKLVSLITDDELRRNKADNAVAIANEHFSYVHFRAKHREMLGRLISLN